MKKESEAVIQQQIYNWVNNTYCLNHHEPQLMIYSVPNGIPIELPAKERNRILDMLKKTGMVSGISDLKIEGKLGRVMSVEVKTSTGVQSPEQKEIKRKVEKLGGMYLLVRSLLDAQFQINQNIDWLLGKF